MRKKKLTVRLSYTLQTVLQTVIVEVFVRFAINDHFKYGFPARINTAFADYNVPHSTASL